MQPLLNVADDLFDLVNLIDPARTTFERLGENVRTRCRALANEIDAHLGAMSWPKMEASAERAIREALASARANLNELSEAVSSVSVAGVAGSGAERWRPLYASLSRNYDQLTTPLASARAASTSAFRRLSPVNYVRNLFHITGGVIGALSYHFLLDRTGALLVMIGFVVVFTTLEILRWQSPRMNDQLM